MIHRDAPAKVPKIDITTGARDVAIPNDDDKCHESGQVKVEVPELTPSLLPCEGGEAFGYLDVLDWCVDGVRTNVLVELIVDGIGKSNDTGMADQHLTIS